ncbi:MAG: DUF5675 family protein, partial [Bacteroidales bacterium]|nr:DUF5675 family protein [Bacteroidales bacterium]
MKTTLIRLAGDARQTLGVLQLWDGEIRVFECKTLELPWRENKRNISCIPTGTYDVLRNNSPKFGKTFHLQSVPGRSEILIHKGNYNKDTQGCILVGTGFADIDKNGIQDIAGSAIALNRLLEIAPDKFEITII